MKCWGHGTTGTCQNCKRTIFYGVEIKLCSNCSIALKQCQVCRQTPKWDPKYVIDDLETLKKRYVNAAAKYELVIQQIKDGTLCSNEAIIKALGW